MYCVKCGVRLADSQSHCPLCGTLCYHPEITRPQAAPLYPAGRPQPQLNPAGTMGALTILFFIPLLIALLCDLRINKTVTWSGYVIGGLLLFYEWFCLPAWFQKPNPVIFVPCAFVALAAFLLYICLATGGQWFVCFALPLTIGLCLLATVPIVLLRYLRSGKLFIFGGSVLAAGCFMPLVEHLSVHCFHRPVTGWSVYPCVALGLFGIFLIFLGICPSARQTIHRKFFI